MFSPVRIARRRPIPRWPLLVALLAVAAGCSPAPPEGLVIEDARVRAPAPGRDMTAGYFTARNTSTAAIVLVAASSPAARAVEMHVSEADGDMMRMRRLERVEIGAGETVRFEPGGRHLMLFGVSPPEDGLDIVFEHADGASSTAHFRTVSLGGD
jgi:copper(I)-binding protein